MMWAANGLQESDGWAALAALGLLLIGLGLMGGGKDK